MFTTKRSSVLTFRARVEPSRPRPPTPVTRSPEATRRSGAAAGTTTRLPAPASGAILPIMAVPAELAAGAVAGLAVAMPVGPVGAHLLGLAARSPWRTAAAAALGVASVDGGYAVAAAVGGSAVRSALDRVAGPLQVVAVLVLVGVAVRTGWAAVRGHRDPVRAATGTPTPRRAYLTLVAMTAVNPATLLTFSAVVLARPEPAGPGWTAPVLFAGGAFVASAAWQLLLAGGGSLLGRVLSGPRARLLTGLASALVVLALAVVLLVRP